MFKGGEDVSKIAIVTDSTAYLNDIDKQKYVIHTVPLAVSFGQETYREGIDIQCEAFYQRMRESKELPTSSQPAVGDFITLYESLAQTHDAIISIHLSSHISGTFQSAKSASTLINKVAIHVVDSQLTVDAQGQLAIQAAKMAKEGYSVDAILERLTTMIQYTNALFVVDDLTNLIKGGRISKFSGNLATALKIKPVLTFSDGELQLSEKIRTKRKALAHIQHVFGQTLDQCELPLKASIIHVNIESEAVAYRQQLAHAYPNVEFEISTFGPVIGVHVGEGALGVVWTVDWDRVE